MRLAGRVVLVTGASSGIGAATARLVARRGGRPVLLARTKARLEEVAGEIAARGGEAHVYVVDCGDREAVAEIAPRIADEVGTPDVIVNNAGAGRLAFFDRTEPEEFEAMMRAPYFAAVFVTRAFLPAMLQRGYGHVVNVNAPIAFAAWPGATGYAAARWALRGFDEALRADLRGTGIRVTQVVPGEVASDYLERNATPPDALPGISRFVRKLTPEQVAEVVVRAVERERRLVFAPAMLRLLAAQARLFPRLSASVLARTASRRPEGPGSGGVT